MELDQVIASAQAVVDALNALKANPPAPVPAAPVTITEIDVDESDGTVEKFVPEV